MVDYMFLVTHHETSGKLRIAPDLLGLGLVAAALAELVSVSAVYLDPETSQVIRYQRQPVSVPAAQYVLDQVIRGEPDTSHAADWILGLRDDLYAGVAHGLDADGLVRPERSALGRMKYVPIRPELIEQPQSWVFGLLRSPQRWIDFQLNQLVIACLCGAMGIAGTVTAMPAEEAETGFSQLLRSVDPQLSALVKATSQAKGRLAMTVRR
jgi:Golgi phosphoprotein 3 (GPP34)